MSLGIQMVRGDLFTALPYGETELVIPHVCNDIGAWGKGFVLFLAKKFPITKICYLKWYKEGLYENQPFCLGKTQIICVDKSFNSIHVANMIAQNGVRRNKRDVCLDYKALINCMSFIKDFIKNKLLDAEIHAPKFGAGLAGGSWIEIEKLIREIWINNGIKVFIYQL